MVPDYCSTKIQTGRHYILPVNVDFSNVMYEIFSFDFLFVVAYAHASFHTFNVRTCRSLSYHIQFISASLLPPHMRARESTGANNHNALNMRHFLLSLNSMKNFNIFH